MVVLSSASALTTAPNETVEKLFLDECCNLGPGGLSHWIGDFLSKNPPILVDFTNVVGKREQLLAL